MAWLRSGNPIKVGACESSSRKSTSLILQHLGIRKTPPRPPLKKIVPLAPAEPAGEDRLPWDMELVFSYDGLDPIYPD